MSQVLVVAAHPDDEALGAGATLARHTLSGGAVHILFLTDGVAARCSVDAKARDARRAAATAAAEILGAKPPRYFDGPDNQLDTLPLLTIAKAVEKAIAEVNPAIIYTHHGADLNVDHRVAHQAVLTAARPMPGMPVRAIYAFEVPSSTEWSSPAIGEPFHPTRFVDATRTLDRKTAALAAYKEEMRPFPHPRSIEAVQALMRWRGATVGCETAEAFEVIRDIVR